MFYRRRLRVLPRDAEAGRQDAGSAAGSALHSPFGTFYVPNISPDPKDGIGDWTEAQFVTAMLKGTSPDGAALLSGLSLHLLPAHDARGSCATCSPIIKTLPAVQGSVRDHDVPFPFNIRRPLGGWKLLFLDGEPFKPDPAQVRGMESRRLSRERPGPLRRMPFARAICSAASSRASASPAVPIPEGGRAGCRTSRRHGLGRLGGRGHRQSARRPAMTPDADSGRRRHGRGGRATRAASARRPEGDGGLSEVAAAGRRPQRPEKIRRSRNVQPIAGIDARRPAAMPRAADASDESLQGHPLKLLPR